MSDLGDRLGETLHEIEEHIPFYLRRWWRWPAIAIAAVVVPIALGLGAFRLIAPQVPGYRATVEARASEVLGWPVAIQGMYLSWYWFGPEVVLQKVEVLDPARRATLFTARGVRVAVSPLDFLRGGEWRPYRVRFEGPVVDLAVTPDQRVLLGGALVGDLAQPSADWRAVLGRLLTHGRLEMEELDLTWNDQRRLDGPLRFTIDAALATDGSDHRLALEVALPDKLGRALSFEGEADGEPQLPEAWRWHGHLVGEGLAVDWLHARLNPGAEHGLSGRFDLDATAVADGLELASIEGRFAAGGLRERRADGGAGAGIDGLESGISWRRTARGWALELARLQVRHGARRWQPGGIALEYAGDGADGGTLSGRAGFLRVEDLELIASWLPEALFPVGPRLHAYAPHGSVSDLSFDFQRAGGALADFHVAAEFADLGFARVDEVPGVEGLRGRAEVRRDGGQLTLDGDALQVDFGPLFRAPLAFDALRGALNWSRTPDGWFAQGRDIAIHNQDVRATARLTLIVPDASAPVIELEAEARDARLERKGPYLPVGIMSEGLIAWLDRAVVGGRAPRATLTLQGPLDRFPFRDGSGLFEVKFHADDAVLDYREGWPRVEGVVADVTFRNAGFEVVATKAAVLGATAHQARAVLADYREPLLLVDGRVSADAAEAQRFVAESPLREQFATYLRAAEISGPTDLGIALAVPLDGTSPHVQVDATLAGARVALSGLPVVGEEIAGEVRFTESSLSAERLTGQLFGAPFVARIAPPPRGVDALARLSLAGAMEVRALGRATQLPLADFASGKARLAIDADLPRDAARGLEARLVSDLVGITLELPPPFAKAAAERVATRAALRFAGQDALHALVEYGPSSNASYSLVRGPRGWALAPGEDSAHISVVAPEVDLDAWLAAWAARPAPTGAARRRAASTAPTPLQRLDIRAQRLLLFGSPVSDAALTARRDGPGWQVEVASVAVAGSVRVPDDRTSAPVRLDMERLWLGEGAAAGGTGGEAAKGSAPDPRSLPAMELKAGSFHLLGADLGEVEATLERRPAGLFLTRFVGTAASQTIEGTGRWELAEGKQRTALDLAITSRDFARTLVAFGVAAPLEAREGRITAALGWRGAPWEQPVAHLGGTLSVRIGEGQLVEVAPGGTGRLVGLMSLAALPRRLKLDFRDVYKKGLAFDSIEGDFQLEEGNAYTGGARIRSPVATITVIGRAGLAARDYDQLAVVETGISSSLPVAGAIAGGLTGGAVMLLLSRVFKSSLNDATRTHYRITGPWSDPRIERVQPNAVAPPAAPPS